MEDDGLITVEQLKDSFPSRKGAIDQSVVDMINDSRTEPEFQGESLFDSVITYESMLKNHRCSMLEYVRALKFCAYLVTVDDNYTEAYAKVFASREFVKARVGLPTTDGRYSELTSAASRYRRSKLIVNLLAAAQVPLDMMFMGARYKAVGVLADEMTSAKLSKDRIMAAKELLAATASTVSKVELEIGPSAQAVSMQDQLDKQLNVLANNQKKMLEAGYSIKDVQKTGVKLEMLEGEVIDG